MVCLQQMIGGVLVRIILAFVVFIIALVAFFVWQHRYFCRAPFPTLRTRENGCGKPPASISLQKANCGTGQAIENGLRLDADEGRGREIHLLKASSNSGGSFRFA